MSVKEELIRRLEENRGKAVSGEALAAELKVSRAAVWKAVRVLQKEGYQIVSGKNRGYTLCAEDNRIFSEGIRLSLPERYRDSGIEVLPVVDSTNTYAKKEVLSGLLERIPSGRAILAANRQTAGKGRLGRSFYSPADTGIYMTLVLRAGGRMENFLPVTVAAAVAVCRMIEALTEETPKIKWVNDVWLGSRKVCGILTEGISNFETGVLDAAIVGIGINVSTEQESFPKEVEQVAVSLKSAHAGRNQMIARTAAELFDLFSDLKAPALMEEYRRRSLILGREIYWDGQDGRQYGTAVEINDAGNLLVETQAGQILLNSGEVSIRPRGSEESTGM